MAKKIRIGSRDSRLAVIQSEITANMIREGCPEYETEIITFKTTGDRILDRGLYEIGGKGLFVKELDRALLENETDITVHSLKDVPADIDERIPIIAYTRREMPYDALVLPKGSNTIDFSKPIGSSSMRRILQLKKIYPEADFKSVRGNVITRLKKLDSGEFSALVLACAGLKRLGLEERITRAFGEDEIVPSAGQGIMAVQGRKGENFDFIKYINDEEAEICAKAERAFIRELGAGCSMPVGAFARIFDSELEIKGMFADENNVIKRSIRGKRQDGELLGAELARKIKEALK